MRIALLIAICFVALVGMSFDIPGQGYHAGDDQMAHPRAQRDTVPDDEEDVYFLMMGQADEAIKDGRLSEAAMILKDAMALNPENPSNVLLMSNLGLVYSSLGLDSLAINILTQAHERAPRMVTVLENRARVNLKAGKDVDAYYDYERVIELDSLSTSARFYHGMMALFAGMPEQAKADFDVLNSVVPESEDNLLAQATYHSLMRDDRAAIPYYKKLISRTPDAEYYAALAGCYLDVGDLYEASDVIAEGLKKYPADSELYYYRAWLNRDRHLNKEARADAQRAIDLGANPSKVAMLNIPK